VAGVAQVRQAWRAVGFLFQHELVDEMAQCWVAAGHPRDLGRGDLALDILEQGQEVPDCKDVVRHEDAQILQPVQGIVDRVPVELRLETLQVVEVQLGHRCCPGLLAGAAGRI